MTGNETYPELLEKKRKLQSEIPRLRGAERTLAEQNLQEVNAQIERQEKQARKNEILFGDVHTMRKLRWVNEKAFRGWACSACGWLYSNPSLEPTNQGHRALVRKKFEQHNCEKYPRTTVKKRPSS